MQNITQTQTKKQNWYKITQNYTKSTLPKTKIKIQTPQKQKNKHKDPELIRTRIHRKKTNKQTSKQPLTANTNTNKQNIKQRTNQGDTTNTNHTKPRQTKELH